MSTSPQTTDSAIASRRDFLRQSYNGIGSLALAGLLAGELGAGPGAGEPGAGELGGSIGAPRIPLLRRKAKRCIFLFMCGGVSQMDSFDYKPLLRKHHGKPIPSAPEISGELEGRLRFHHSCVGSAFEFARHGQSGRWMSDRFPHLAQHADKLAFIHGIKTDNQNHGPSTLSVTTGSQFPGHPSVGSWVSYGLGSSNRNLPGYVVIQDPRGAPTNGAAVWSNGYLPAAHQGTLLRSRGTPILNLERPAGVTAEQQRREFDALRALNERHLAGRPGASELEARIGAYELAFRMQSEAPDLVDISSEDAETRQLYGLDDAATAGFGRQCLLARRLVERDVRYTLLVHGVQIGRESWDDHGDVEGGMRRHSREVDQPVAALLTDLDRRGLLEDTLVVWTSEMGRTPFVNGGLGGKPGREHNSWALTVWMAGGNVKGGTTAGETDPFGLRGIGDQIHIRDVHATILDLLGLDDARLRYLHAGRLRRLTDIGGRVLDEVMA